MGGSFESVKALISGLANKPPVIIHLQEELAVGNSPIETEAGISPNEEILKVKKKYEGNLEASKEEMKIAMKDGEFVSTKLVCRRAHRTSFFKTDLKRSTGTSYTP